MQHAVDGIIGRVTADVAWGICLRRDGAVVAEVDAGRVLPTASMGKVLLLLEVARRMEEGSLDPRRMLAVEPDDRVADSGLWQHLREPALSAESLAVLVAAVSDNLATNVLLREVGLEAVARTARACGLERTRLLDRLRDLRGAEDPPAPSEGCAGELAGLLAGVGEGEALGVRESARVARWLALDVDVSMVAGGLGVDPLAHADGSLVHKTGWDTGVRADAGYVRGGTGSMAYAVLAHWQEAGGGVSDQVLDAMRAIGALIREAVR